MRDEFTALLLSQVGQHEGRDPDGTWNNEQRYSKETPGLQWSDGQPWCATFQAWGAHQLRMDALWPMTASCLTAVAWWQQRGRWSSYPVLGGPFYVGPDGGTHTGVVVGYDATTITTVEGNSNPGGSPNGDGVYQRTRLRSTIYGYGVPAYPEGTISADPKLGGTPTAHVNPIAVQEDDMPYTEQQLRTMIREEASGPAVRDANAYAVCYWLACAVQGTVPDGAGQSWANLLGTIGKALTTLPADAKQEIETAVSAALADGLSLSITTTPKKG